MTLNRTASSTQASFPNGCKVFDVRDPAAPGVVFVAGPEVSEVKFPDGKYRNIPNAHLRTVDASIASGGLTQVNSSPDSEIVRLGQEALSRKRRGWHDWLLIANALQVGRSEVMRDLHVNEPHGARYEKAMGNWLVAHSFKEIDKGTRNRLLECLKHKNEIEKWRARLTDAERFRFNHPNTVLRKWKASTVVGQDAPKKQSPIAKLKESIVALEEVNARLAREAPITPNDTPKDQAATVWRLLNHSPSAAHALCRALTKLAREAEKEGNAERGAE